MNRNASSYENNIAPPPRGLPEGGAPSPRLLPHSTEDRILSVTNAHAARCTDEMRRILESSLESACREMEAAVARNNADLRRELRRVLSDAGIDAEAPSFSPGDDGMSTASGAMAATWQPLRKKRRRGCFKRFRRRRQGQKHCRDSLAIDQHRHRPPQDRDHVPELIHANRPAQPFQNPPPRLLSEAREINVIRMISNLSENTSKVNPEVNDCFSYDEGKESFDGYIGDDGEDDQSKQIINVRGRSPKSRDDGSKENLGPFKRALQKCNKSSLRRIDISGNPFGEDATAEILGSVSGDQNLTALHLDSNCIGKDGCAALATLLTDAGCELKELHLHNRLTDADSIRILTDALIGNKSLKKISLGGSVFDR